MSRGKSKTKEKHKRSIRGEALDFVSPLTENQCVAHLRSGRSNVPEYDLRAHTDGSRFQIQFMRKGFLNSQKSWGRFGTSPRGVQSRGLAASSIKFAGKLEPHVAGTRVTGKIIRGFGTSRIGLAVQQGVALLLLLLFFREGILKLETDIQLVEWSILSAVLSLIVMAIFTVNRRLFNRQADALLAWVTDRLDIQRSPDL